MIEIDKKIHEVLKKIANTPSDKFSDTEIEKIPKEISEYISKMYYISPNEKTGYLITREGVKELRILEEIASREKQLSGQLAKICISITALIISFISLYLSMSRGGC